MPSEDGRTKTEGQRIGKYFKIEEKWTLGVEDAVKLIQNRRANRKTLRSNGGRRGESVEQSIRAEEC